MMFYCDACARKRNWPRTLKRSRGQCEICQQPADCNDKPSSELPEPKK